MKSITPWVWILSLSVVAVIALAMYAFMAGERGPLALLLSVPFLILGRIALRRLRRNEGSIPPPG